MTNKEFNRRDFIKKTSLATGGILIGFKLFESCTQELPAEMELDLTTLTYLDFNAYIKISKENKFTIYSTNPEIGQGVKTAMPMIIAEELDVAWNDVHVVQAGLDTKNFNRQMAGGSASISLAWEPLREVGAVTREMLLIAAAAKWNVDVTECRTEQGMIYNGDLALTYGDVAEDAVQIEIPEVYGLKSPSEFKIIGQKKINVDAKKIVTGVPLFGIDYKEEGMLYATVIKPPSFDARLIDFDATEAFKVEGVVDVIRFGEKGMKLLNSEGINWTVRYHNTEKVAVIAKSTWAAFSGAKKVNVNWQLSENKKNDIEFLKTEVFELMDREKGASISSHGDINVAKKNADKELSRNYTSCFLPHSTMEPMNFFADVKEEKIRLIGPTQTPEYTTAMIAKMMAVEIDTIETDLTRMGGGFGRRLFADFAVDAVEISSITKKPIKLVSTRENDMLSGIYRPLTAYSIQAYINNNEVSGIHISETGVNANSWAGIANRFPAYCIPNLQFDTYTIESDITVGFWRAPISNYIATATQCFMDELAEKLKQDPIDFQLNLLQKGVEADTTEAPYSPERMMKVVEKVRDMSGWKKDSSHMGFSVFFSHETYVAQIAEVKKVLGKWKCIKVYCAVDCGFVVNPMGAENQIKGSIIDGLGHMTYSEIPIEYGKPTKKNFDQYRLIRMKEVPEIEVEFIESQIAPTGLGEPGLPPIGAAFANAMYKVTGKRWYNQPFINEMEI